MAPFSPQTRLGAWNIDSLAVAPFADATHQAIGPRFTRVFLAEAALVLQKEGIRVQALQPAAPAPLPVGLLDISQSEALGRRNRVDALVDGRILAYQWQPGQKRVWVSANVRLLEARDGALLWARNIRGVSPVPSPDQLDAEFDHATIAAAKEFLHDLLEAPS